MPLNIGKLATFFSIDFQFKTWSFANVRRFNLCVAESLRWFCFFFLQRNYNTNAIGLSETIAHTQKWICQCIYLWNKRPFIENLAIFDINYADANTPELIQRIIRSLHDISINTSTSFVWANFIANIAKWRLFMSNIT